VSPLSRSIALSICPRAIRRRPVGHGFLTAKAKRALRLDPAGRPPVEPGFERNRGASCQRTSGRLPCFGIARDVLGELRRRSDRAVSLQVSYVPDRGVRESVSSGTN
jgi:hypothetical protein